MARDWEAVAAAINTRLAELDMTQQELARQSGISVATLRQLQHGMERRRSPRTLADVSRALRWPPSYLGDVADQREPRSDGDAALNVPAVSSTEADLSELRLAVAKLGQRLDAVERRLEGE